MWDGLVYGFGGLSIKLLDGLICRRFDLFSDFMNDGREEEKVLLLVCEEIFELFCIEFLFLLRFF